MNFEDTKRKTIVFISLIVEKMMTNAQLVIVFFFLNLIFEKKRMTTNYTLIIVPFCVCLFVVEKTTMNTLTHLHLLFLLFFLQQIMTTMSWALIVFLFSLYVCPVTKKMMTSTQLLIVLLFIICVSLQKRWWQA